MTQAKTFISGVVAGAILAGVTAYAAERLERWSRRDIDEANELFAPRSGLRFEVNPPEPDRQVLVERAHPVEGITQVIRVVQPSDERGFPPDPCFTARLEPPPDPDRPSVTLQIEHPELVDLRGPDGGAATLCSANGTGSTSTNR